jgi:UDP-glucose 4-epimerase
MTPRDTTILVTGADGFVGTHLCRWFAQHYTVYAFILPSQEKAFRLKLGLLDITHIKIIIGEFKDLSKFRDQLAKVQFVIHCAGTMLGAKFESYYESNVVTTQLLLKQLPPNLKKLLFLSSQSALGPSSSPNYKPKVTDTPKPISFYGQTKLMAEKEILKTSVPVLIFRPAPIMGPEDKSFFEIFKSVNKGFFPILGQKQKQFQYIHVQDLMRAIETALFSNHSGKIYHIAYPVPGNWEQMIMAFQNHIGKPLKILYLNPTFTYLYLKFFDLWEALTGKKTNKNLNKLGEFMAPNWIFDTTDFTYDFDFKYTRNLDETIHTTYSWYQNNSWLK